MVRPDHLTLEAAKETQRIVLSCFCENGEGKDCATTTMPLGTLSSYEIKRDNVATGTGVEYDKLVVFFRNGMVSLTTNVLFLPRFAGKKYFSDTFLTRR